jgi:multicomponent Na+:H+ antiporter subunit F
MNLVEIIAYFSLPVISFSILLVFIRVIKGPTLPDRVIALDLLVTICIGLITAYSIVYDERNLIDVAIILALLAFLGTVAFAYYLGVRGKRKNI